MTTTALKTKPPTARPRRSKVPISQTNLRKAATRLLGTALVSTEVLYVQRSLGPFATQEDLDAKVLAVRKMPWANLIAADPDWDA